MPARPSSKRVASSWEGAPLVQNEAMDHVWHFVASLTSPNALSKLALLVRSSAAKSRVSNLQAGPANESTDLAATSPSVHAFLQASLRGCCVQRGLELAHSVTMSADGRDLPQPLHNTLLCVLTLVAELGPLVKVLADSARLQLSSTLARHGHSPAGAILNPSPSRPLCTPCWDTVYKLLHSSL